jgi:hypothetical protein
MIIVSLRLALDYSSFKSCLNIAFNQLYFPDRTLLHITVQNGNAWMVKVLLHYKANPNVKDSDNSTPLHEAVLFGSMPIIKGLLSSGALVQVTRKSDKKTPFELTNDPKIKQLLAEYSLRRVGI